MSNDDLLKHLGKKGGEGSGRHKSGESNKVTQGDHLIANSRIPKRRYPITDPTEGTNPDHSPHYTEPPDSQFKNMSDEDLKDYISTNPNNSPKTNKDLNSAMHNKMYRIQQYKLNHEKAINDFENAPRGNRKEQGDALDAASNKVNYGPFKRDRWTDG